MGIGFAVTGIWFESDPAEASASVNHIQEGTRGKPLAYGASLWEGQGTDMCRKAVTRALADNGQTWAYLFLK